MATNSFFRMLAAFFLLLLLAAPQLAEAQVRPMTLDEIVSLGSANSRQLQISKARVLAAEAKIAQYRDQFFPAVTYSGSYYRLSDNVIPFETPLFTIPVLLNQTQNRLALSETVFTGFRAKNTIEAGKFLANAARFDAARDQADVKLNLIAAAMNLYRLQEARKVFDTNLATSRNRQRDLSNLRTQGLALDNDVLKAELAIAQLEAAQLETDNAVRAAQFSISVLCDLPENTQIQVDSASLFSTQENLASLEEYLSGASNTAAVKAAHERSLAAGKQVSVSKGVMLPLVNVGANYYYNNPNQRQFPTEDRFIGTWDVGVGVTWNLSSFYTSRHQVEESRANLIQNETLANQLTDAARTDIAGNFYTWQSTQNKIAVADKAVVSSLENQRIYQLRQTEQINSATDLLEADALLLQSQINGVTARVDAQLAWYRLQKSAGRL